MENLVNCIDKIYKNQNQACLLLRSTVVKVALVYFLQGPVVNVFVKVLQKIEDFRINLMNFLAKE